MLVDTVVLYILKECAVIFFILFNNTYLHSLISDDDVIISITSSSDIIRASIIEDIRHGLKVFYDTAIIGDTNLIISTHLNRIDMTDTVEFLRDINSAYDCRISIIEITNKLKILLYIKTILLFIFVPLILIIYIRRIVKYLYENKNNSLYKIITVQLALTLTFLYISERNKQFQIGVLSHFSSNYVFIANYLKYSIGLMLIDCILLNLISFIFYIIV